MEYDFLADCTKKVSFLQQVVVFILISKQARKEVVHEDNKGAIHLAKHPVVLSQSKHIDVTYNSSGVSSERVGFPARTYCLDASVRISLPMNQHFKKIL